jgi:hypothetical protein
MERAWFGPPVRRAGCLRAVPLPDWSQFDDADLAGLDEQARAVFRDRAIPSPARVTRDPQHLSDERRYDVPVTVICTEFTSGMLREWIDQGLAPVREFTRLREVEYVDLPRATGRSSPGLTTSPGLFCRPQTRASASRLSLDS